MDERNAELTALRETVEIAHLGMILHMWNLEDQTKACKRVVELMRPEAGVLIVGQMVGHVNGVEVPGKNGVRFSSTMSKHSRRRGSTSEADGYELGVPSASRRRVFGWRLDPATVGRSIETQTRVRRGEIVS